MNILHIIRMDLFKRLGDHPHDTNALAGAFKWALTKEGHEYWRHQYLNNRLSTFAIDKIKIMQEHARLCVYCAASDVGVRENVMDAYVFVQELDGIFFSTDDAFYFSDQSSAIAFKLRFG